MLRDIVTQKLLFYSLLPINILLVSLWISALRHQRFHIVKNELILKLMSAKKFLYVFVLH